MSADDQLREAYRDLANRSERAANQLRALSQADQGRGQQGTHRPRSLRRPALALAGVAVVVAATATTVSLRGGDQPIDTDGPASDAVPPDDADDPGNTLDGDRDGTGDGSSEFGNQADPDQPDDPSPDDPWAAGQRIGVDTSAVAADSADPFLNVRAGPDADADLVAKLPATYTGLLATGEVEAADDGGTWILVELLDPVRLTLGEPLHGGRPAGWVNQAFVEVLTDSLPVGTDDVEPCGEESGGQGANGPGGLADPSIYALESASVADDCLRIVLTFADGPLGFGSFDAETVPPGTGPAGDVPSVFVTQSGGFATVVDLGPVADLWPTETMDGIYLVRQPDGFIDLVYPFPVEQVSVASRPDRGIVVVDLDLDGPAGLPSTGESVVIEQALISDGSIEVTGLARPFESVLGVSVVDDRGQPVRATFSGDPSFGVRTDVSYGVTTTDWVSAWGRFAVRVEGLSPGDYTLLLDSSDGNAAPSPYPFTIDQTGSAPNAPDQTGQQPAIDLVRFARGDGFESINLADEVTLALGTEIVRTVPGSTLSQRENWTIDVEYGFGGFVGPFNALDAITGSIGLTYSTGPMDFCAGPPRDWPAAFDGLDQVNIEPIGIDSCIAWFGISLFLNADDEIEAVALDYFGP